MKEPLKYVFGARVVILAVLGTVAFAGFLFYLIALQLAAIRERSMEQKPNVDKAVMIPESSRVTYVAEATYLATVRHEGHMFVVVIPSGGLTHHPSCACQVLEPFTGRNTP